MLKTVLILLLCIGACGKKDHAPQGNSTPTDVLRGKYEFYLSETAKVADGFGFVGDHCDSLLFTSLAAHAGLQVDVFKAEKTPGEWHRHPAFDCWPASPGEGSDSSISKDMFAGLLVYLSGTKDAGASRRIVSYGSSHNWVMGTAKDAATLASKCLMSLGLISDFKHLAGMSLADQKSSDSVGVQHGYLGHLDILRVYASSLLYGGISASDSRLAQAYCEASPRNALYCAVSHRFTDGNFERAMPILLGEVLFPSDRLPSSTERCTDYLWSHDDAPRDWSPCPSENKTYQGVDFLIAAKVILNDPRLGLSDQKENY